MAGGATAQAAVCRWIRLRRCALMRAQTLRLHERRLVLGFEHILRSFPTGLAARSLRLVPTLERRWVPPRSLSAVARLGMVKAPAHAATPSGVSLDFSLLQGVQESTGRPTSQALGAGGAHSSADSGARGRLSVAPAHGAHLCKPGYLRSPVLREALSAYEEVAANC